MLERMGLWHRHFLVEPRHHHCDFGRHIFRELNGECDELSNIGNKMGRTGFVFNTFLEDLIPSYFFCAWAVLIFLDNFMLDLDGFCMEQITLSLADVAGGDLLWPHARQQFYNC